MGFIRDMPSGWTSWVCIVACCAAEGNVREIAHALGHVSLPPSVFGLAMELAELHQAKLIQNWKLLADETQFGRIGHAGMSESSAGNRLLGIRGVEKVACNNVEREPLL